MSELLNAQLATLVQGGIEKAQAAGELPAFEIPPIVIERPKAEGRGDYATGVCLGLARFAKRSPLDVACTVVEHMASGDLAGRADFIGKAEAVAPGFINFTLNENWLAKQVETIVASVASGKDWGGLKLGHGERVQVEFVSANPTGPLTVANSRNACLGDALANVLAAAGYAVHREYYVNDKGSKIRKMGNTLYTHYARALGVDEPLPEEHYPGQFLIDVGQELAHKHGRRFLDMPRQQAIQEMGRIGTERTVEEIRDSLAILGVHFDTWFSERSLYTSGTFDKAYQVLQDKGWTLEKDGAVWFAAQEFGQDKDAVLIRSAEVVPDPRDESHGSPILVVRDEEPAPCSRVAVVDARVSFCHLEG